MIITRNSIGERMFSRRMMGYCLHIPHTKETLNYPHRKAWFVPAQMQINDSRRYAGMHNPTP
jgi:hypothetical protein